MSWDEELEGEDREQWDRFVAYQREHVLAAIAGSAAMMSFVPEEVDIKVALELGMAIYLNKPIIVLSPPGRPIPEKLVRVADRVVSGDIDTEEGLAELREAMRDMGIIPR